MIAPIPENEGGRLAALDSLSILDTPPEPTFDRITGMAARVFRVPTVLISLVDRNRQWFKARHGLEASETSRDSSFCAHAILASRVMVVPHALLDPRFADNPLVTGPPHIRFYAGAPLRTADGYNLGTLCLIDSEPRTLGEDQVRTLADLAAIVVNELELRVATRRAAESEERKRVVVDAAPDAIISVDERARIVEFNPAAERTFGCSAESAIGCDIFELIAAPRSRAGFRKIFEGILRHGSGPALGRRRQTMAVRADGSEFPIDIAITAVWQNRKPLFTAYLHDITERKRQQRELRETNLLQQAILDSADCAIISTGPDGIVRTFNRAAERMLGYTAEEVAGKTTPVLFHDAGEIASRAGELSAELGQTIEPGNEVFLAKTREGVAERGEWTYVAKDGTRLPVQLAVSALRQDGEIAGFLGVATDISDRKRAESEMKAAKEVAEAAGEAKSSFLANMSHEIRTPMNAVIGMTGLLLDTGLTDVQRGYTETIRSSGNALLALVNDILDFSKIESGKLEIEQIPFDLGACVQESLDLISHQAAVGGIEIAFLRAPGTPLQWIGDVARLRQILANLLSNAIKFTKQGEVVVSVSAKEVLGTRWEMHFAVRDTGIGIPEERLHRLFQSFSQVDASTTRHYGGTGLGLAISKRLTEMMDGSMWVESVYGEGSTFHFKIQAEVAGEIAEAEPGRQHSLNHKRILLVKGAAAQRQMLQMQTEAWGMECETADSAPAAVDRLHSDAPFDATVLDIATGVEPEILAAIRESGLPARGPILVVHPLGWKRETFSELPGWGEMPENVVFLSKPVNPSLLYNALAGGLAGGKPRAAPPARSPAAGATLASRIPLRILVAEDHPVNQKVALLMLSRMGYRADVASNGIEAVQACARQEYDVVLMDMQMPEMDGVEAAAQIRARSGPVSPHIIALTANAMQGDRDRCIAAGMNDFLTKPTHARDLQTALERFGAGRPAASWVFPDQLRTACEEGLSEVVDGVLGSFLEETPLTLTALRAACGRGDREEMAAFGHALEESCAQVGALKMATLCGKLDGEVAGVNNLDTEFENVARLIRGRPKPDCAR